MGRMKEHVEIKEVGHTAGHVDLEFIERFGLHVKRVASVLPPEFFGYIIETHNSGLLVYLPATYWSDLAFDVPSQAEENE